MAKERRRCRLILLGHPPRPVSKQRLALRGGGPFETPAAILAPAQARAHRRPKVVVPFACLLRRRVGPSGPMGGEGRLVTLPTP